MRANETVITCRWEAVYGSLTKSQTVPDIFVWNFIVLSIGTYLEFGYWDLRMSGGNT